MRRTRAYPPVCCSTMSDHWTASINLLLRAGRNNAVRVDADETSRRNVYSQTFLRIEKYLGKFKERRARDKQETGPRDDADDGIGWEPARPKHFKEQAGAHQVPIPLEEPTDHYASPGMEHRYYLHPVTGWLCVFDGSNRLVQSASPFAPAFKQPRWSILFGRL